MSVGPDQNATPSRACGGNEAPMTIPVRQEEISIDTETVDTGRGVRVTKTVRDRPVVVEEILRREQVDVRRVPVDRIVADAPPPRREGATLIIPVVEEILVVEKKLRVTEEIHITTTAHEEPTSEVVNLKSEEVTIQRFDENKTGEQGGT